MKIDEVAVELLQREPVFHHPEFGRTRSEIENYVADDFMETAAKGNIYHRDFVINSIEERYKSKDYNGVHDGEESTWKISDRKCTEIADNLYLFTYELDQIYRSTRRSTIWRHEDNTFKIVYHQGMVIQNN